jgi:hypothetical protein
MNSLTTLFGLAAQTAKGTPGTSGYSFRALSVDSTPNFEEILNQIFCAHQCGLRPVSEQCWRGTGWGRHGCGITDEAHG